jgi:hypothetical protein
MQMPRAEACRTNVVVTQPASCVQQEFHWIRPSLSPSKTGGSRVVYAVATDQHGFIFGALACCGAQANGYVRARAQKQTQLDARPSR